MTIKKAKKTKKVDEPLIEQSSGNTQEIIEDPLIVDKILSHRTVKRKKDDDSSDEKMDSSNKGL